VHEATLKSESWRNLSQRSLPENLLAFGIALAEEDPKTECIYESPTIPIIYAIAKCIEIKLKIRFKFLVETLQTSFTLNKMIIYIKKNKDKNKN